MEGSGRLSNIRFIDIEMGFFGSFFPLALSLSLSLLSSYRLLLRWCQDWGVFWRMGAKNMRSREMQILSPRGYSVVRIKATWSYVRSTSFTSGMHGTRSIEWRDVWRVKPAAKWFCTPPVLYLDKKRNILWVQGKRLKCLSIPECTLLSPSKCRAYVCVGGHARWSSVAYTV